MFKYIRSEAINLYLNCVQFPYRFIASASSFGGKMGLQVAHHVHFAVTPKECITYSHCISYIHIFSSHTIDNDNSIAMTHCILYTALHCSTAASLYEIYSSVVNICISYNMGMGALPEMYAGGLGGPEG